MLRTSLITILLLSAGSPLRANDAGLELFETKIRPVLIAQCYECHSAKSKRLRGGLRVDLAAGLRKGGESGDPAVVPGKAEAGTLLSALQHETFEMPPAGKLSDEIIADFEKWIRMGAPDPRVGDTSQESAAHPVDIEAARKQWAFQAPELPAVPRAEGDEEWNATDIDRFIYHQAKQQSLPMAELADAYTRLRRLTFDLTGLPPSPADIERFVADPSPAAWRREVDRLLATKTYAERWGRHWLDVARFAESSGGGRSLMFPHAWRYRDYVIQSFAKDKPFDVFLTEQIAGDLLPYDSQAQRNEQLTATSYLVLGAINYELQDKELLVMEVIDEQLEAIGRGFMGMTMACARCHDHKFDPITSRDYYSMAGIFSSTRSLTPGNVSGYVTRMLGPDRGEQRAQHQKLVAAAKQQLKKLEGELAQLRQGRGPGLVVDNKQARLKGDWQSSTILPHVGGDYVHDQFEGKGEKTATFTIELPEAGEYEVRMSYNTDGRRAPEVPVSVHHAGGVAKVRVNQQKPPGDGVFQTLGFFRFDKSAEVVISNEGTDGFVVIADAVQWRRKIQPDQPDAQEAEQLAELKKAAVAVEAAKKNLRELQKQAPPEAEVTMGVEEAEKPADGHVRVRGQVRVLGDLVPRGFLSVVDIDDDQRQRLAIAPEASGRLQLAQWLASPQHPLTSRVMANRVWGYLMGEGIVRTVDNFGAMGESPTHPELLDHLAVRFRENGWSVKQLIREIVLSRTYQSSSETSDQQRKLDPENRWLARARRRRLDSDAIRDSLLSISGKIQAVEGGRTIRKLSAYDLGYEFGDNYQRSVYVPAFRNARVELLDVFDAPNPNLVSGRRAISTLPTQALFMLNSPFVLDLAAATAAELDMTPEESRAEAAFLRILNRPPRPSEVQWAQDIVTSEGTGDGAPRWTRFCQLLFASVDFRYLY